MVAVRDARQYVRAGLIGNVPEERLDDVVLVVSEVVTNAVVHGAPPGSLIISMSDDLIRIEVSDSAAAGPVREAIHHESQRGRGIGLMDTLSDRWGVTARPEDGKVVWFEVDRN